MKNFIYKDLKNMIGNSEGLSISILAPIEAPGKGDEKNKIRFKNLLQKCEDDLVKNGLKKSDAEKKLENIREQMNHPSFFRSSSKGIAIYISKDFNKIFHLDYELPEKVSIGDAFFIKPLLPSAHGNGEYFILGLSKNDARLFSANKNNIFEVDISNITKEAEKEINMIDSEKHFAFHSGSSGGSGTIFHGQDDSAMEKDMIKQYFRLIDEGLKDILNKHKYPLLLVGIDYLLPIYQEINNYNNIISKGITGNPDDLGTSTIHKKSWEIINPLFKKEMMKDIETFHNLNGTGNASADIEEIATKAEYGQVAALFVNTEIVFEGNSSDLINKIAINTIKNNGNIYGINTKELLNQLSVAAVYRY